MFIGNKHSCRSMIKRNATGRMKHPGNQPQVRACFTLSFLLAAGLHLFSQGFTLEGSVTDKETGAPVPFVTVYINGTTLGTIT